MSGDGKVLQVDGEALKGETRASKDNGEALKGVAKALRGKKEVLKCDQTIKSWWGGIKGLWNRGKRRPRSGS